MFAATLVPNAMLPNLGDARYRFGTGIVIADGCAWSQRRGGNLLSRDARIDFVLFRNSIYDPRPMPWRCPACHIAIRHSETEDRPRPGVLYRCHVCRLELKLDPTTDRLTVMPLPDDQANQKPRETP